MLRVVHTSENSNLRK